MMFFILEQKDLIKPEKNSIFLKNGKTVICRYSIGENFEMMKRTSLLELSRKI